MTMRRGSVTVFLGMTIMLVASLGLVLLEVVRYYGMFAGAYQATEICADSVMSEYVLPMWQQYHILGLDYSRGRDESSLARMDKRFLEQAKRTLTDDVNYFALIPSECSCSDYLLMTDCDGAPFVKSAIKGYTYGLPSKILDEESSYDFVKEADESDFDVDKAMADANDAMDAAASDSKFDVASDEETDDDNDAETEVEKCEPIDVIDQIKEWKSKAVLSCVIDDEASVSDEVINIQNALLSRDVSAGKYAKPVSVNMAERTLFSKYLGEYFSAYDNIKKDSGIRYELEYVVGGKESDKQNLENVVERLLLSREVSNVATIICSPKMYAEVQELAISLGGASGNPFVVEILKAGIIAAWAYTESVLDVRTMLCGGRVALIKSDVDWTSQLLALPNYFPVSVKAKSVENGVSYRDYLFVFLSLCPTREVSYRAMDVIEDYVRSNDDYKAFRMDRVMCSWTYHIDYNALPIFSSLIFVNRNFSGTYSFSKDVSRSYI